MTLNERSDTRVELLKMQYVAARDTKNFTVYVNEEMPENKLNQLYLPKGLPQTIEVTISAMPTTAKAK